MGILLTFVWMETTTCDCVDPSWDCMQEGSTSLIAPRPAIEKRLTFQVILFDMDDKMKFGFPARSLDNLGSKSFDEDYKYMIEEGAYKIVLRPQIRAHAGRSISIRKGGEVLQVELSEIDGEAILNLRYTLEQKWDESTEAKESSFRRFSIPVRLKNYEGHGILLGPFTLPNGRLRCINLSKVEEVALQRDGLEIAEGSGVSAVLEKQTIESVQNAIQRELDLIYNSQFKMRSVHVNDLKKPTRALATSVAAKVDKDHKQPDSQSNDFMVVTFESADDKWFVIEIDFETESGAEKELNKFLEANPNSIGIPLQS